MLSRPGDHVLGVVGKRSAYGTTYDPEVVRAALKRLDAAQTPLIRSMSSSRYSRTA
jgi:hypothetical protein